jgi:hypothetical protein
LRSRLTLIFEALTGQLQIFCDKTVQTLVKRGHGAPGLDVPVFQYNYDLITIFEVPVVSKTHPDLKFQ